MSDPLPSAGQKRSAPDSDADAESLNGDTEWVEENPTASKGHRQLNASWQYFKMIHLTKAKAKSLHRNYDGECKACGKRVPGQPAKLKTHLQHDCKQKSHSTQLRIHQLQAEPSSGASSMPESEAAAKPGPMTKYVDKVKISAHQLFTWRKMLCLAFVMTGWSFVTVENAEFVTFISHIRPNFELPSEFPCTSPAALLAFHATPACRNHAGAYMLRTSLLQGVLADVALKQAKWMADDSMAYHLTLTLDGWSNARMESVYSWNIIFPSRKVILLRADDLSGVSHTGEELSGRDFYCCMHDIELE